MTDRLIFKRDGVRLAALDFGGRGSTVLFLHGLAGYAGEWSETASWLTKTHRAVALDARGHGDSDRRPADVSPAAQVGDVSFVIEQLVVERLAVGPVVLVGHSLGGLTALMVAAQRPELVRALVLADAFPGDGGKGDESATWIAETLRRWPVPFRTREAAATYFAKRFESEPAGRVWAEGLAQTADGWRPRFDIDVMAETMRGMAERSTWPDWQAVKCPVLVARPGKGLLDAYTARKMGRHEQRIQIVELPDAQHDLHLDRPDKWRLMLAGFLRSVG
ncbi:MAG TPA: alpha/beta hydrolase [Luteitalea sp.]|nr:alpha/beta hydrolase [Luteitalea sp.]